MKASPSWDACADNSVDEKEAEEDARNGAEEASVVKAEDEGLREKYDLLVLKLEQRELEESWKSWA